MKRTAIYPGSFDPFTNGHLDILVRACKLFDEVIICIASNPSKNAVFTFEQRKEMIEVATKDFPNIKIKAWNGLVVDFAKDNNAHWLIRGIRTCEDYTIEADLHYYNHEINPEIETVYMLPSHKNKHVSSSAMKTLVAHNLDIEKYVPASIVNRIRNGLKQS